MNLYKMASVDVETNIEEIRVRVNKLDKLSSEFPELASSIERYTNILKHMIVKMKQYLEVFSRYDKDDRRNKKTFQIIDDYIEQDRKKVMDQKKDKKS